ncbi:16975_t:CDS:2 [Acaulospora colombiana]|uniref:16975_t:CDS:1 n=1 Tax=Acaulospora colombiana TaxID=27376 RepID=A0ACA9MKV6_9GLOM|nr:16975_t:CDS:2 [Acaulospora colombiana]
MDDNVAKRKRITDIVVDTPNNLDLDSYISNYKGHTKVDRLLFIAKRCPTLQIDAYRLALQELRENSLDTTKYLQSANKLNEILVAQGYPSYSIDGSWVDSTQKRAKTILERLDTELKNYKNNLIKESIRVAESTPDIQPLVQAKLKVAAALAHLDNNKYKQAANLFLETSFEIAQPQSQYSEVISPNDIAIYGALCALASFDRKQLKKQVIDNAEFKQFLELEPNIRELIYGFYNSKYNSVLTGLENYKNDFLLDIHLHNHVETLYDNIRKKALVQYFSPFLTVDMNKMAESFGTNVLKLEKELAKLITENLIQARIDSHKKVLCAKQQDHRSSIFQRSLKMGDEFELSTNAMLLRMNLLKANLLVQTAQKYEISFIRL